jgi:hypothetical protein
VNVSHLVKYSYFVNKADAETNAKRFKRRNSWFNAVVMMKNIVPLILVIALVLVTGCVNQNNDNYIEMSKELRESCLATGGTISGRTTLNVPSVTTEVCECGENKFWNDTACQETSLETACINSGGTVTTATCCESTEDFYIATSKTIGACGCSAENSHEISVCACPEKTYWTGATCEDVYIEMSDADTQKCLSTDGQIIVETSVGGIPYSNELCDCGNMVWSETGCMNELI